MWGNATGRAREVVRLYVEMRTGKQSGSAIAQEIHVNDVSAVKWTDINAPASK